MRDLSRRVNFFQNIQYSPTQLEQLSIAEYIQALTPVQKKKFHAQNPELSELLFMNEQQKTAYFQKKNQQYFKNLQHEHHRHTKTHKMVKFNDTFQVKYFNNEGSAQQVATQDAAEQPYNFGIHFTH